MNSILLFLILIPAVEIYLFIKIGSQIGAFTTIFLIFATAIIGVYYAKFEGLNTLKSGIAQLSKNKTPTSFCMWFNQSKKTRSRGALL